MPRVLIVTLLAAPWLGAVVPGDCHAHTHRGRTAEARRCYLELAASGNTFYRAEGLYGLRQYKQAHDTFRLAVDQSPKNPDIRVRWGRLLIEKFNQNKADGADLFREALEIDKNHAGAKLGLALIASGVFEAKAVELAGEALKADPKLVEAQELLAHMALEDSNPAKAVEEAGKALKISGEALDALAIRAAVEILADRPAEEWLGKIRAVNPVYGRAHALIAHHLEINRRYEEAIEHFRKAVDLDPGDWATRSELGVNLMRLGREVEARAELQASFDNGCRNAQTVNTLTLIDSYKNYLTFETPSTIVKLHRKEAAALRPYIEDELVRAISTYEKKYQVKLPRKVQLEIYPDHPDFEVRTMGMPGLGALGVTFGDVVAMDSPSARKPGSFHWAGTLWHELSHVFVLIATRHRVPRWFTEGVAVHEESATHKDWGDRLTPDIILALKGNKLLPVAELDRGFIRPSYPSQVIVSYFQAGRMIDYVVARWGWAKVLEMMHAFAARTATPDVVKKVLGVEPAEFDKQFLAWLDKDVKKTVDGFEEWSKRIRGLAELARANKSDEVIAEGNKVLPLYPDYVEAANAYEFLAQAYLDKGDKKAARNVLQLYVDNGGRYPETIKKLAGLQEEAGDKQAAAATLDKINVIYPVNDEALHTRLGGLWFELGNYRGAIREYLAVIGHKPLDTAAAHFNAARAYHALGDGARAEDHLLEALESAPGFRPAQKLLLELKTTPERVPKRK